MMPIQERWERAKLLARAAHPRAKEAVLLCVKSFDPSVDEPWCDFLTSTCDGFATASFAFKILVTLLALISADAKSAKLLRFSSVFLRTFMALSPEERRALRIKVSKEKPEASSVLGRLWFCTSTDEYQDSLKSACTLLLNRITDGEPIESAFMEDAMKIAFVDSALFIDRLMIEVTLSPSKKHGLAYLVKCVAADDPELITSFLLKRIESGLARGAEGDGSEIFVKFILDLTKDDDSTQGLHRASPLLPEVIVNQLVVPLLHQHAHEANPEKVTLPLRLLLGLYETHKQRKRWLSHCDTSQLIILLQKLVAQRSSLPQPLISMVLGAFDQTIQIFRINGIPVDRSPLSDAEWTVQVRVRYGFLTGDVLAHIGLLACGEALPPRLMQLIKGTEEMATGTELLRTVADIVELACISDSMAEVGAELASRICSAAGGTEKVFVWGSLLLAVSCRIPDCTVLELKRLVKPLLFRCSPPGIITRALNTPPDEHKGSEESLPSCIQCDWDQAELLPGRTAFQLQRTDATLSMNNDTLFICPPSRSVFFWSAVCVLLLLEHHAVPLAALRLISADEEDECEDAMSSSEESLDPETILHILITFLSVFKVCCAVLQFHMKGCMCNVFLLSK